MADSEEEVDVLVQRVVKDISNAFKRNPNIGRRPRAALRVRWRLEGGFYRVAEVSVFPDVRRDEIGVIPCPEARCNRSPIVLVENKLGVESWCIKLLLPYVHHKLLLYRQRKHWLDRDGRSPGRQVTGTAGHRPGAGHAQGQNRRSSSVPQPWWTSPPPCCCSTPTSPPPGTSGRATAAWRRAPGRAADVCRVAGRSCCSAASSRRRRTFIWENWLSPSFPRARRRGSTGKARPALRAAPPPPRVELRCRWLCVGRRWVLQQLLLRFSPAAFGETGTSPPPDDQLTRTLGEEMKVCRDAACRYPSNYNAWSHRIWVLQRMARGSVKLLHDELSSTRPWVSMHVSDHSGFHYRQFLLQQLTAE
ncbi:unnamed protein product, partial [Tetraodon nigroviridis]